MSCIAGIINLDGAPVDRGLLERMTIIMKDRAPDGTGVWVAGNVGLGHAMLRILPDSENEQQPCTLDGQVWITADARIDGRSELIAKLRSAGEPIQENANDAELILHAYAVFGENFLDHLIGDFAFALWDSRNNKLLCARDQFGVRPFYYVKKGRVLLFASDIDALLLHPDVTRQLDEAAIGDFLVLGFYQEAELSIYRDVRCLPPASLMVVDHSEFICRKYWELSQYDSVRYRKNSEYVEHFQELHKLAVSDRLRTNNVALELSGGMDSTSVAAIAAACRENTGALLTAYTSTCNELFPDDEEGYYASMVGSHLSIPMVFREMGGNALFERFGTPALLTMEPTSNPSLAFFYDTYELIKKSGARVLLSGQGGDAVLDSANTYYAYLLQTGRIAQLFAEVFRHVRNTGTLSGMGLRSAMIGSVEKQAWRPPFPGWLDENFVKRTQLRDRWDSAWNTMQNGVGAYHQLGQPWLSRLFSTYDILKFPLVTRHPFFDVRLIKFLLALPGFVKSDKKILREAMGYRLPEKVCARPKTAAVGDFVRAGFINKHVAATVDKDFSRAGNIYVDARRYSQAFEKYLGGEGAESSWSSIGMATPITLNYWLRQNAC